MINNGADVNLSGRGNDTPLIAAARVGFDQGLTWLLQRGAKVDGTNKMGETPLIIAVQQRQTRIIKALLDAGADPDKSDTAAGLFCPRLCEARHPLPSDLANDQGEETEIRPIS